MIFIRPFLKEDIDQILELYRQTVRTVNICDYSPEQIAIWAPEKLDKNYWLTKLQAHYTVVAEKNNHIVGFGSMTPDGVIYYVYVHKDFQRQKVGSKILEALEQHARTAGLKEATTESSITALPFFQKHGYQLLESVQKPHKGTTFLIHKMKKELK